MNSMASILMNVIRAGQLPLTQVSERIETMYLTGRIDAKERMELTELMHEKANPANELGDWKEMYEALAKRYTTLEGRVKILEEKWAVDDDSEFDSTHEGYDQWEPWDGVSHNYVTGAIVVHAGTVWKSVYPGQNVWEPGAPGIDERYWVVITDDDITAGAD